MIMFVLECNMKFAIGERTVELEAETSEERNELTRALQILRGRVVLVGNVISVPDGPDRMAVEVLQLVVTS
jgi:hypothetical protein